MIRLDTVEYTSSSGSSIKVKRALISLVSTIGFKFIVMEDSSVAVYLNIAQPITQFKLR